MNPTDLSEEMRQKLAAKAKNKPDYKTRLCKNFMETAECDYGEICNYAHGKDELNTDAINAKSALEEIVKKNPAYRTSLCKSGTNCRCAILIIDCEFLYCNNISLSISETKTQHANLHTPKTSFAPRTIQATPSVVERPSAPGVSVSGSEARVSDPTLAAPLVRRCRRSRAAIHSTRPRYG